MKKLTLSLTPTPMHPLEQLSKHVGVELWIKRDDLTGDIATGGNKIRKLEYLIAHALELGADTLITTGGPQSNHAKATAALAARAGLKSVLILAGTDPGHREANLFINQLVGAEIRFSGARTAEEMEQALLEASEQLKAEGRKPYLIPIGGSNGLGSLGYLDAYTELGDHDFDWMVVTAGSGGTYAGLAIGLSLAQKKTKLLGISPWLHQEEIEQRIKQCIIEACTLKQLDPGLISLENRMIDDHFIGQGYGKRTDEATEAIKLVAQKEAIILDHVYTGKAMAGLLAYIDSGRILPHEKVLFWHTGGALGLMAIQNKW